VTVKNTLPAFLLLFTMILPLAAGAMNAQTGIPTDRLLSNGELVARLDTRDQPALAGIQRQFEKSPEAALEALAAYFRDAYAERYYFDWQNLDARFAYYRDQFPSRYPGHRQNAAIHAGLYPAEARWKLPYRNLKGDEVSAYELRHLARQHKVLDNSTRPRRAGSCRTGT
jgi:alpha-L-fucosidase